MVYDKINAIPETAGVVEVQLSNQLVHLLSDQLYQSPLKAIEELVVNSYDAGAKLCKLFVPLSSELSTGSGRKFMVVFDNGGGLTAMGMTDLWYVGHSKKRENEKKALRKQIGKFGIGKLATYSVSNKLTYISKTAEGILCGGLDFNTFSTDPSGKGAPVKIQITRVTDWKSFSQDTLIQNVLASASIDEKDLAHPTWTIAILEDLKLSKAGQIKHSTLRWVLSTAMPLKSEFRVFLNGTVVESSKQNFEAAVTFKIADLPKTRIDDLNTATKDNWRIEKGTILSDTFQEGISGEVLVTKRTLPGKSDDLLRSHGFFVKVRGRLINEEDPFFGMTPLHHGTLNRFRADIDANDLDKIITAPREGVGNSPTKDNFEKLLVAIFQEARQKYEKSIEDEQKAEQRQKEAKRSFIGAELIEHPMAGALVSGDQTKGAEADNTWFYVTVPTDGTIDNLAEQLYSQPRTKFQFVYTNSGKTARLVTFNVSSSEFRINSEHVFAAAHVDDPRARILLEDIVIAEAMLEVQLRLAKVPPQVIGEVLEERDKVLRGLALDHPYSRQAIAKTLRDSAANQYDLEIALIACARALGFVAKHISGADEPDGIARFVDYPKKDSVIILEAKSSSATPALPALDFAGLHEHMKEKNADGCLLVAPDYPGNDWGDESGASNRARNLKISCWKIEQLARVVEAAEQRHITTKDVLEIVLSAFAPGDVTKAVEKLFVAPKWSKPQLYSAIIGALESLALRLRDKRRTIDMLATEVSREIDFSGIDTKDIEVAVSELAAASQGGLILQGGEVYSLVSLAELRRRVSNLIASPGYPARLSTLRADLRPSTGADDEH